MPRTKIVCTLGPACRHASTLRSMIRAGMNVARLNLSHGTQAEHRAVIRKIRRIAAGENRPIGILADLAGPKFRLGRVRKDERLREGRRVRLLRSPVLGAAERLSLNRPELLPALARGHRVMISDGSLQLEVIEPGEDEVLCRVVIGGLLRSGAGLNMPDSTLDIPSLTEKDLGDIAFCVRQDVDFIGLSFVRSAADVELCRKEIRSHRGEIPIIAKMEMREAIENLEEIVDAADGVMVARGDLGIEAPLEEVPRIQKRLIARANAKGKPVITATEMLLSMVEAARPTRAEVSDVANAILDGTDAIMLSQETAVGRHPAVVVRMMARIAEETEEGLFEARPPDRPRPEASGQAHSIAHTSVVLAEEIGAALIISPTDSGDTPRRIARLRPRQPILALSTLARTIRRLTLTWGVIPWKLGRRIPPEKILSSLRQRIFAEGLGREGDYAILSAGYPFGVKVSKGRVILTEEM
ncbi:MAG: pyruvate kinase [bacterium]